MLAVANANCIFSEMNTKHNRRLFVRQCLCKNCWPYECNVNKIIVKYLLTCSFFTFLNVCSVHKKCYRKWWTAVEQLKTGNISDRVTVTYLVTDTALRRCNTLAITHAWSTAGSNLNFDAWHLIIILWFIWFDLI